MNKSSMTSVISLLIYLTGLWLSQSTEDLILIIASFVKNAGAFALAGSVTNWLAIHMLFEKVPLLYGSGVILNNFEAFKLGIKHMILEHFFSKEHFESLTHELRFDISENSESINKIMNKIDTDKLFDSLIEIIQESQFSTILKMFGGMAILEKFRAPFKEKISQNLIEILNEFNFEELSLQAFSYEQTRPRIEQMLDLRLEELSALEVKEIIANMIKSHLGWLVVWGGIFGALLGIIDNLIP